MENMEENKEKRVGIKRRFLTGFLVGLVVMAGVGFAGYKIGTKFYYGTLGQKTESVLDKETTDKIDLLTEVIQGNYYEEVDAETLQNGLYKGLFQGLDEYSEYLTEEEYNELFETSISGKYSGIGATLQQNKETMVVTVVNMFDGSPAEEAGLQEDDIILTADGYHAETMELNEFVRYVRGDEGTSVHLVVLRDGEELEFDIVRKRLEYPSVEHEMLEDNIGYIYISDFSDSTVDQFKAALADLEDQGMTSLIVDLRDNLGGMVTAVTEILDELLPEGLLVYTEENGGKRKEYRSTDAHSVDVPIAVIVNDYSASASEIFAGAMQDREAGTIIGTVTYGKGVVQTVLPIGDGTAARVTISRYYTPNGVCIHEVGIIPDIELEYEWLGDEDAEYSYEFDNQIQKAIEVLQSK